MAEGLERFYGESYDCLSRSLGNITNLELGEIKNYEIKIIMEMEFLLGSRIVKLAEKWIALQCDRVRFRGEIIKWN